MVICAKSIYTHIEFTPTEKKRVQQISLAYVRLRRVISVESFPLGDVCNFVEKKDSFALAFRGLLK